MLSVSPAAVKVPLPTNWHAGLISFMFKWTPLIGVPIGSIAGMVNSVDGWRTAPGVVHRWQVEITPSFVDLVWLHAEAVFWLDYSLPIILCHLWKSVWRYTFTREVLWGTNEESLRIQFFSWDSIFLWLFKLKDGAGLYSTQISQPQFSALKVYLFRSPGDTNAWLKTW